MDEVLANALRSVLSGVTAARTKITRSGVTRIGSTVKAKDGREYVVWKDGSLRRKDKLERKMKERRPRRSGILGRTEQPSRPAVELSREG